MSTLWANGDRGLKLTSGNKARLKMRHCLLLGFSENDQVFFAEN